VENKKIQTANYPAGNLRLGKVKSNTQQQQQQQHKQQQQQKGHNGKGTGKKVFDFKVFDKFVVAATNGSSWSVAADDNNNNKNDSNNNNQRKQLRKRKRMRVKERSQSCLKVSLQIEWEGRKSHQKHI